MFFIETEKNGENQATPFNILPLGLANAASYIDLAGAIPSSPIDLSDGWARARHIMGLSPLINFYSKENVEDLLARVAFLKKTQYKFFLAWQEFSIKLIELSSIPTTQSIVLTDNNVISEYFKRNQAVHVVLYNENQNREEIYERCNREVIDLFTKLNEKDFAQNPITERFHISRCLEKSFLERTRLTCNILCNANEVVMAQVRGKPPQILTVDDLPALDTFSAYCLNVEIMEEILAERLVDIMLGTKNKEIDPLVREIPNKLQECIDEFANKVSSMTNGMKMQSYSLLKQAALDTMKGIKSRSEVFLLIPTVNPACRRDIVRVLRKRFETRDPKELNYIIDRILIGGRGVALDEGKIDKLKQFAKELANTRLTENRFLTEIVGLMASRKLSPVLKSVTVPSFLFDEIQALRFHIASSYLSDREKPTWCTTVGEKFAAMQSRLYSYIPALYVDALEDVNPSFLTIISDLPFEIANNNTGLTICQAYPTTRIPITPLGSLFNYYNTVSGTYFVGQKMASLKNILLVNSIEKEDRVYWEFEVFQSTCKKLGFDFETIAVHSSEDFIKSLNSRESQVLIYFGHGKYDSEKDIGELIFKEDRLSYKSFNKIEKIPPVVFLIGCETASCVAFSGGLPSHLLERGVFAVLATLFPIPADEAGAFIGRTLAIIKELIEKGNTATFSEIIFHARKLGWMRDNLESLRKVGAISTEKEATIMENASEVLTSLSFKKGKSLTVSEAVPILKEILRSYDLEKTWDQTRQNIIPYSLFFTLLGDTHDVLIGG